MPYQQQHQQFRRYSTTLTVLGHFVGKQTLPFNVSVLLWHWNDTVTSPQSVLVNIWSSDSAGERWASLAHTNTCCVPFLPYKGYKACDTSISLSPNKGTQMRTENLWMLCFLSGCRNTSHSILSFECQLRVIGALVVTVWFMKERDDLTPFTYCTESSTCGNISLHTALPQQSTPSSGSSHTYFLLPKAFCGVSEVLVPYIEMGGMWVLLLDTHWMGGVPYI